MWRKDRNRRFTFRGRWRGEIFYISLSIRGLDETKSCIHASSSRHSRVCIDDKRIDMTAEDQEQRFRGSISLTVNDCIIDTVSGYFSVLNDDDMIHGFLWWDYGWARIAYLLKSILCFHTWMRWKSYDSEIRTDHAGIVADGLLLKVFRLHKIRRSLGHMKRMFGCKFSRGALVLLSIMHFWHYDGSEIWSLSWGLFGICYKKSYL